MGTRGYHERLMRFSGVFDGQHWCCSNGGVGETRRMSTGFVGRWYETGRTDEKEPSACLERKVHKYVSEYSC